MCQNDRDQWKSTGICSKCRRERYCSHVCKAAEKMRKTLTDAIVSGQISTEEIIEKAKELGEEP